MKFFKHDILFSIVLFMLVSFLLMACSEATPSEPSSNDTAIEAQAVATATPALPEEVLPPTTEPDDSASDELSTEIIEPTSPVSPVPTPESEQNEEAINQLVEAMQPLPGSEKVLAAAIEDLIQETGATADQITMVEMQAIQWSDASLGCPQEGFMYAQVITAGFRIVLETQGVEYIYHTNTDSHVVLCQEE